MYQIRLHQTEDVGATVLPNHFIDTYMPAANGEFVKLYIYLLRCLGKGMEEVHIDYLADRLLCTEGDILRALRYWESQNLIRLSLQPDGKISAIDFSVPALKKNIEQNVMTTDEPPVMARSSSEQPEKQVLEQASAKPARPAEDTDRAEYLQSLLQNEDVQQILFIAEQYLGKTLSPTETDKLIYFYDSLHMSVDLIDYLIEYCVGKGHKSIRYIEAVALSWKDDGVDTVEKAKKASFSGRKEYFSILRALGIQNRNPVESEIRFMDKWLDEYSLPLPVIFEACSRTILKTGQPSFPYADRILTDWNSQGVTSVEEISRLDETHQMSRPGKKSAKGEHMSAAGQGTPSAGSTRFNNFSQRDYDYSDVEKQLLHLNNS